jgi:lysozyme
MPNISNDTLELIEKNLVDAEGRESKPYYDTAGKLTIGVGWNLTDIGLPDDIIDVMFVRSIDVATQTAAKVFPSFCKLSPSRQAALVELSFNLGEPSLRTFKKFRAAVDTGNWEVAKNELLNSKWALQVKSRRANRVAEMMLK